MKYKCRCCGKIHEQGTHPHNNDGRFFENEYGHRRGWSRFWTHVGLTIAGLGSGSCKEKRK